MPVVHECTTDVFLELYGYQTFLQKIYLGYDILHIYTDY